MHIGACTISAAFPASTSGARSIAFLHSGEQRARTSPGLNGHGTNPKSLARLPISEQPTSPVILSQRQADSGDRAQMIRDIGHSIFKGTDLNPS